MTYAVHLRLKWKKWLATPLEPCHAYTPGGGGGTPLYKVYRYVPPQRVWFLSRFGLKTGIDFDNYDLKSGRIFGAGNIYESLQSINIFFFSVCNWND